MAKESSIKRKTVAVPQDQSELEQFVAVIHRAYDVIASIQAETDSKIAKLAAQIRDMAEKGQVKAKPFKDEIDQRTKGVYIYAQAHRKELTEDNKKKTVEFISGDLIRWRFSPSAVMADDPKAIDELESRGLTDGIRIKKELNREWILEHPEAVEGFKYISISQEEIFSIVLASMGFELQRGEKRRFKKVKLT